MTEADALRYRPFVRGCARRFRVPWFTRQDLVGEGWIALLRCEQRYMPGRAATFTTYAFPRVRGAMLDYLRRHDPVNRRTREAIRAGAYPPLQTVRLTDAEWRVLTARDVAWGPLR